MDSKNRQTKTNLETYIRLGIIFGFCIFWMNYGFEIVKKIDFIAEFISKYSGNEKSLFTWNTLIFSVFFFAIYCYPILIVMGLSITLFDKNGISQLSTKKNVIYFLISPLAMVSLIIFFFAMKFAVGIVGWAIFIGYPTYLLGLWIYEKIKK